MSLKSDIVKLERVTAYREYSSLLGNEMFHNPNTFCSNPRYSTKIRNAYCYKYQKCKYNCIRHTYK